MTLSPLMLRRIAQFRHNRRGYISLWLLTALFLLSLFAEFIANDKPLLVQYDGRYYMPIFRSYPETTFGGSFETETNYQDPYVQTLITSRQGWLIFPPIPYSYDTIDQELTSPAPTAPDARHLLGTDDQGRDVVARLLYGFRLAMLFALCLTTASAAIGIVVGAIQGTLGGWTDLIGQRLIDIWSGMPVLYLLLILTSFVQPTFGWLLGIMLLFSWMSLVGLVRAECLRARNFDYVRAARALGVTEPRIMFRHILPNALVSSLTMLPFLMSGAVTTLASLDFLGFGLPPGSPALGELLGQGKNNLHAPWLGLTAFVSMATLLTLLVFLGEAIRDAFDPHKQA